MTSALSIIAEPQRQRILQLIWHDEKPAGDIAAEFDITFGAVSQHLQVLRRFGFVSVTKRGKQRIYRANPNALGSLVQYLETEWARAIPKTQTAPRSRGAVGRLRIDGEP
jgi:DNA-binding transcriptional ArsR family regulator